MGMDIRNLWRKIDDQFKQMMEECRKMIRKGIEETNTIREKKRIGKRIGNITDEEKGERDEEVGVDTSKEIT